MYRRTFLENELRKTLDLLFLTLAYIISQKYDRAHQEVIKISQNVVKVSVFFLAGKIP